MLHRVLSPLHATIQEQEDSSTPAAPGNLLIPTQEHLFLEMLKPKSCSITSTARLDGRLSLFCQPNPGRYGRRYIRFFGGRVFPTCFPTLPPSSNPTTTTMNISPFIMLVHHRHSLSPLEPIRWFQKAFFLFKWDWLVVRPVVGLVVALPLGGGCRWALQ